MPSATFFPSGQYAAPRSELRPRIGGSHAPETESLECPFGKHRGRTSRNDPKRASPEQSLSDISLTHLGPIAPWAPCCAGSIVPSLAEPAMLTWQFHPRQSLPMSQRALPLMASVEDRGVFVSQRTSSAAMSEIGPRPTIEEGFAKPRPRLKSCSRRAPKSWLSRSRLRFRKRVLSDRSPGESRRLAPPATYPGRAGRALAPNSSPCLCPRAGGSRHRKSQGASANSGEVDRSISRQPKGAVRRLLHSLGVSRRHRTLPRAVIPSAGRRRASEWRLPAHLAL